MVFCVIFSACGTPSRILCYIFLRAERPLVFCVLFFVFVTCSGILWFIFLRVKHALVFCFIFSECGTCSGNVLYFSLCGMRSGILFYICLLLSSFCVAIYLPCFHLFFLFRLFVMIFDFGALVLWKFLLHLSVSGTRSDIVLYICHIRNALWYCGISCYTVPCAEKLWYYDVLCYIDLCVAHALVLWNLVLYFSCCVTSSGILEICILFFCLLNALRYCGFFFCMWNELGSYWILRYIFHILKCLVEIIQLLFVHMCCFFVLY